MASHPRSPGAAATAGSTLPQGVVTFLFTDIAGSTRLLQRLGEGYGDVLWKHRELLRASFHTHAGHEMDTQGDSFFVVFASPSEAVAAAADAQQALAEHRWPQGVQVRVRMGLHTGEPLLVDGHYVGMDVHRAARIAAAAHGGQVVMSSRTAEFVGSEAGVRLRDLGQHRLKDLDEPEQIMQLLIDGLPDTFPPLTSEQPPTNLPRQVSTVVGRQREMRQLRATLLRDDVRLLTVTGPGGTGKTRLSAAVAHTLLPEFLAGVFFVDLSTVGDADRVTQQIALSLGVVSDGDTDAEHALSQHIGRRQMLLLLDNFEQVPEAAVVLPRLLSACPALNILVTSRLALSVQGERVYELPPMELARGSTLADAQRSEAVQLFVERARMVNRTFELTADNAAAVADICALVDGLPLAIELAAARTKLFSPRQLLHRLDNRLGLLTGGAQDSPIRHRALRTTIDWSYDLLSAQERAFFRDLAVFSGGADYDAIESVVATEGELLDLLTALVNHSLVRRAEADGQVRFRMLQTLGDYAEELLLRDPDHMAELRERHAQYFLALSEADEEGADSEGLEQDQDNIRAALGFWLEERAPHDPQAGVKALRLAAAQATGWYHHGQAVEGIGWLERALRLAVEPPVEVEAKALRMLGVLTEQRSRTDEAIALFERALAAYRGMGDRWGEAASLNGLGIALRSGQRAGAEEALRQAAEIREELGDHAGLASTLNNLGVVSLDQGMTDQALALFTANLRADRERGDDWGVATTWLNLGLTHLLRGEHEGAQSALREALAGLVSIGDHETIAEALEVCLGLGVARGQWMVATRTAGAADALRALLELPSPAADRVRINAWTMACRDALGAEAFDAAWAEGSAMTEEQATTYALTEVLGVQPGE